MEPVKLEGNKIDEVETFTYLGSIIDKHSGTDADITARIGKARGAFIQPKNIWSSKGPNMEPTRKEKKRTP